MKKLLTFVFTALLVGSASAVTMQWGATGVSWGSSKLKNDTGVVGYLIACDALGTSYALDGFDASDIGTVVDTNTSGTSTMSKLNKAYSIDTDTYGNGDTFAVLLTYQKDGKTYYNLTSGLVSMSGMATDPPTNAANTTSSFSWADNGEQTVLTAGTGWTTLKQTEPVTPDVPEPATGALALAGVALLFKRRRA